jgi:nitroreductase
VGAVVGEEVAVGSGVSALDRETVEAVLEVAVRAPSIHNTQPWRWELRPDGLVLLADRSRQLSVADPDGHSLMISCGGAAVLTELALRAAGFSVEVRRIPDPSDPDLLARFETTGRGAPDADAEAQVDAALRRRSDRRPFRMHDLPAAQLEELRAAAGNDLASVDFPMREDQRINLAVAVSWADRIERHDEEYMAEMQKWLRDPEVHDEGVAAANVPHVEAGHPRRTDVPQRDFEIGVTGKQLIQQDVDEKPLIAVILTGSDAAEEQFAAGEAMMRLMLRAEQDGIATCPLSQAVDLVAFRTRLQGLLGWVGYPQMMMRMGYPGAGQVPATPRRPVSAVLDVVESA